MPDTTTSRRSAQAKHAAAVRWHKPNQTETGRDFAFARLEDYIQRIVADAPPLTDEQRSKLAVLLRGSTSSEVGAA